MRGRATPRRVASPPRAPAPPRAEAGQASVELVALLPLLVALALGAGQLLAAGIARELAGHAAQAGAMAILQGGDPEDAARAAIPGWSRAAARITADGHTVAVTLRPRSIVPGLAGLLTAHADASAGP